MKIAALLIIAAAVVVFLRTNHSSTKPDRSPEALPDAKLSEQLEKWKAVVDEHALPAQRLRLTGRAASSPIASKIGGQPYWTNERPYPASSQGEPLHFLAQINFAELDERPSEYPDAGLLQFFIGADDLYGSKFEKPTPDNVSDRDYAVVFHEQPDIARHIEGVAPQPKEEDLLPFSGETGLRFDATMSTASPADYRFEHFLPGVLAENYDAINPLFDYAITGSSHQIGGYAMFTQQDPRDGDSADENWQLLLQIDSDEVDDFEIMWGDVGIGNFFIRPEDLAKRDFSQVWYNWDCH
ncbi:MAG: YwqG family protein [Gammaproteobacteria bacterium]